jgi:flagellar biosynthesis/type III secretory pathway M-ring protein FliF/YscJ
MLLMVVKPVLIRLLEGTQPQPIPGDFQEAAYNEQQALVPTSPGEAPSNFNAANSGQEAAALPPIPGLQNKALDRMLSIQQVEGQVRESSIKQITHLIEDKPTDAVGVVREWMHEG